MDQENKPTLKQLVASPATVNFSYYRKGELWYVTSSGFEFPVPIGDTGDGTFNATDKAMLFMRYIRKHLESIEQGQKG